jgi:diguanylate cyclase (GGDEF)-like protein
VSALDLRLLGRLGGAGLLTGALTLFALMAVEWDAVGSSLSVVVAFAAAVGGLVAMRVHWSEDATRSGMALAGGAYVALGLAAITGGSQATYGPLFVVVSAWCGMALGPSYTLKLAPLALLCDTLPAWLGRPGTALTGLGAIAVATLTGEIFARLADRARRDARRDAEHTHALELLTAGQLALTQAHDPREAAGIAAQVARDILDAERSAMLLARDGGHLVLGKCPQNAPGESEPWEHAIWTNEDVVTASLKGRDGTGVRGVLTAQPHPGQVFDPFGKALVASLAAATSAALESIALNRRLRVRAEVDPLTGLGNRRRLDAALARLRAGDVIIVLDLDHFKRVNDTLGHDVGDRVLREFGSLLSTTTRSGELAIRTGGEEFVLIAEGGEQAQAAAALLARLAAGWWHQTPLTTFSAGAAVHQGGDPAATMKLADQALYEAKGRGRAAGWLVSANADDAGSIATSAEAGRLIPFPGAPFGEDQLPQNVILPGSERSQELHQQHA